VPDSPPLELLDAARSVLGMKHINQRVDMVGFENEVVSISLDPVLEGYLADMCILKLRGSLVNDAMVRVGRAVRVLGSKSESGGLEDGRCPIHAATGPTELGRLMLGGAKERQAANACHAFEPHVEGLSGRISWVMDPATGLPATKTLFALVVASTSFEADALSYALVVRGVEGAPRLLARFPKCEALVIPADDPAQVWLTPGMREIFSRRGGRVGSGPARSDSRGAAGTAAAARPGRDGAGRRDGSGEAKSSGDEAGRIGPAVETR
jgi:hypothetical protein